MNHGTIRHLLYCLVLLLPVACGRSAPSVNQLAAQSAPTFDPNSLSYKAIPPTDLPPEGTRSTFDYVIKENNALPFPFENLVKLAASYDADGRAPVSVLIPDGRSLLKAHANFKQPRIVVAANPNQPPSDSDLGLYLRGRLFMGYVEAANEIEVISYNEQAGRFEFQLVKDYREGGQPRIVYARRAICTTCHAGAAPIFPVRPWEETNGQPGISAKILAARGVEPAKAAGMDYHGASLVNTLSAPEAINDLVDLADAFPTTQQVWIDGCGGDPQKGVACRRLMLGQALRYLLNPGGYSSNSEGYRELAALQQAAWPKQGIVLASGNLLNRNPFTDRPRRSVWQWLQDLLPQPSAGGDSKITDFDRLPPLRQELDPLTPRAPKEVLKPGSETAIAGLAQLFSPNDRRLLEQASGYDAARLEKAVQAARLTPLLGPAPFRRVAVMQALLAELGRPVPKSCCINAEGMSAPIADGVKPITISEGSPLKLFEHYCFGCHRGNPNAKLDFMDGKNEAEVLAHIKATSAIREALDYERYLGTDKENKLMPPKNSWQRAALDRSREEKKDDVKKMRDTVPGLFDF